MGALSSRTFAMAAACCALHASAADPSAVWSRNFNVAENAGSTLDVDGNSAPDSGDNIQLPYEREGRLYYYVFTGAESGVWENMSNWRRAQDKIPYARTEVVYQPAVFDGELMQHNPVTATDLEGWQFKVALYNGAVVNVGAINKFQDNTGATDGCFLRVDATSKLVFGGWGTRAGSMEGTTLIQVD